MQLKDVILTKTVERHIAKHKVTREEVADALNGFKYVERMKKVKIRTEEDLENLPEDEVVEVESCDIKFRLVEKGSLHTEVSVSEEEVNIPLPEELYEKVKGKRVVVVPKG
ncbi:MAG: hypothetical protein U9R10_01470 [Euryarchaeota archaeon]|nr:hypothetical protein [Euryarchaeota archaeon]